LLVMADVLEKLTTPGVVYTSWEQVQEYMGLTDFGMTAIGMRPYSPERDEGPVLQDVDPQIDFTYTFDE
jgi:hypothetical protein